jgi:dolichyl-phosphate-mannose-protein mannosyltransferase
MAPPTREEGLQRMSASRLWLALVCLLFCLPLFVGLDRADLRGDEAAYSFGVDRILEIGQWLEPKTSPEENLVFLEKPPLGFWIVAAPIRFGLLPNNEFGLRFWSALFGGVGFLYVFGIGRRLAGNVCGAVAVLILFVHDPLLFQHGLRTNTMEAPLFLCYCGGTYHYFAWLAAERAGRRALHAVAVGLYFVLGFMTKDVAAVFLPLVLGSATLAVRPYRTKFVRDWRLWAATSLLVAILCVPWFVYVYLRFGSVVWETMLGTHVYKRFTSYLDPNHLEPWNYYFVSIARNVVASQSAIVVLGGLALLTVHTIRRRWAEGGVILLWFWVPLCLMSLGTSKLYHYTYPFLPPLALAGGYFVSFLLAQAHPYLARVQQLSDTYLTSRLPRIPAFFERPIVRGVLLAIGACAMVVSLLMVLHPDPLEIKVGRTVLLSSSGLLRPLLTLAVVGMLAGLFRRVDLVIASLLVAALLPLAAYRAALLRLDTGESPLRTASDCVRSVAARPENADVRARGMYLAGPKDSFGHEYAYYFHRMRPLRRSETPPPAILDAYLHDTLARRPVVIAVKTFDDLTGGSATEPVIFPLVDFHDGDMLLLPDPYGVCRADAAARPVYR